MHHVATSVSEIPRRLDKYLRDSLGLTRSECERAWEDGEICVVPPVGHLGALVFPAEDEVYVRGVVAKFVLPNAYVAFHKPKGIISTLREPIGRPCLDAWISAMPARVFPVGRLDRDTTGLMLLTDDGDLANMLLHPKYHVDKHYTLTVEGPVLAADSRAQALLEGITLDDGPARALRLDILHSDASSELAMVVNEGRNRMVRRMAARAGFRLMALHRTQMGPQVLGNLEAGEWRILSGDEVDRLWLAAGGRLQVYTQQLQALKRRAQKWRAEGRPFIRLEAWLENQETA